MLTFICIGQVWVLRSIKNVPQKSVRVALVGLRSFLQQINLVKPDLSHPDILKCYNITAQTYGTEPILFQLT